MAGKRDAVPLLASGVDGVCPDSRPGLALAGDGRDIGQSSVRGEKTGPNPTDRGKSGTKRSALTDGNGIPLALVVAPANRHDMKLFEATLEAQRIVPPAPSEDDSRQLCLDRGYDYDEVRQTLAEWGYEGHIPPSNDRDLMIRDIPNYRARRWVVERTHSWMNRFRRLLVRWEKKPDNYLGMMQLASAFITFRSIEVFG